jgi:prolyl-tRNA synthetase
VALCEKCEYAANLEVAASRPAPIKDTGSSDVSSDPEKVSTPEMRTIEEVSGFLKVEPERLIKTLVVMTEAGDPNMVLLAGDDELEESKLQAALGEPFRPAHPEEILELFGCEAGFLGPVNAPKMPVIADHRIQGGRDRVTGANEDHFHITGVNVEEHFKADRWEDLRTVKAGEGCPQCEGKLRVSNAIEIGHIFKLGTKYSSAMGANILDADGHEIPIVMGSYGIGVARIIACAIELFHDENGIVWPESITPYDAILIGLNLDDSEVKKQAEDIYDQLQKDGFEVLYDDRNLRPGFKFKDADLLGIPYQAVVSSKSLAAGGVEVKTRSTGNRSIVNIADLPSILRGVHG